MTSPRPLGARTRFATDDTYSSGSFAGQPNKLALLTGEKSEGWHPEKRPPAEKFNKLFSETTGWADYVADLPILNWYPGLLTDVTNTTLDTTYTRQQVGSGNLNAVSDIFWSTIHKRWIVCGSNTAGSFYIADQGFVEKWASGASSPPNLAFGCESGSRVLLFTGTNRGTAQTIDYVRSAASSIAGGFTKLSLPGTVAGNAHAGKAIGNMTGLGFGGGLTTIVCGGRDGNHKIWASFDDGATFLEQNVAAATGTSYLDRMVVGNIHTGGTRRIIAFTNDSTANGGKKIYYSDGGYAGTWNNITFSDDGLLDIVYDDSSKLYFMVAAEGSKLYVSSDPIGGSVTSLFSGSQGSYPKVTALNVFGDTVVFTIALSATESHVWMIGTPGVGIKECHRVWGAAAGGSGLGEAGASSLPGTVGVSPEGRFALMVPGGIVQFSMKAFSA